MCEISSCVLYPKFPIDSRGKYPLFVRYWNRWGLYRYGWILYRKSLLLLALVLYKGYVSLTVNSSKDGGMPNGRIFMRKIKEVLRLKYEAIVSH